MSPIRWTLLGAALALLAFSSAPEAARTVVSHSLRCALFDCVVFAKSTYQFREPMLSGDSFGFRRYLADGNDGASPRFALFYLSNGEHCIEPGGDTRMVDGVKFVKGFDDPAVRQCLYDARIVPSASASKLVDLGAGWCCEKREQGIALISVSHPEKKALRGHLYFSRDQRLVLEVSHADIVDHIEVIPEQFLGRRR